MAIEPRVPARYYVRLLEVLNNQGVDSHAVLADAGLQARELEAQDAILTLPQIEALVAAAIDASGQRSELGLDLAAALKLTSHSAVSYGILTSPTAGYALRLVARFFGLILPLFRLRYATDARAMNLHIEPVLGLSRAALDFHLELVAAAVHWELRDLIGGAMPAYDAYYSIAQPPHAARYGQLREMRPHFGWKELPGVHMRWPVEVASRVLALADADALAMAESRCTQMLEHAQCNGRLAAWVGMMLRETSGAAPSHCELARMLHISPRTLDRSLKKEGKSFRALSKQSRRERACRLLAEKRLSVTEIAMELGYSDVSNFARAFRRETGVTPREWMAQGNASAAKAPAAFR